jgi:hypothetical protein
VRHAHRWITLHFTPVSGSWLNLAEVFFRIITRKAIGRDTFTSVGGFPAVSSFFSRRRGYPVFGTAMSPASRG